MKVIKSDGRYKFFDIGFTAIVEFATRSTQDRKLLTLMETELIELYGHAPATNLQGRWCRINDNYRVQSTSDVRTRRIYLKDESLVSFLLLKMEMNNG
jgi:hypothetical protein